MIELAATLFVVVVVAKIAWFVLCAIWSVIDG
jgi:hypothetical protein